MGDRPGVLYGPGLQKHMYRNGSGAAQCFEICLWMHGGLVLSQGLLIIFMVSGPWSKVLLDERSSLSHSASD